MSLFAIQPAPAPRWPIAIQASVSMAAPIAVMHLFGYPALGIAAGTGAFTVLFVAGMPTVERAKVLPLVAAGLILAGIIGVATSPWLWLVNAGVVLVSIVGAMLAFGFRLGPPGPIFFVIVCGLSAQVMRGTGSLTEWEYLGALAAGCVFSYLIAMTPLLLPRVRRHPGRPLREILPGPAFDESTRMLLLRVALVAVVGVLTGQFVDPNRTYWIVAAGLAVIGVIADRRVAFHRSVHRLTGTLAGAAVYALIALLHPEGLWLALVLAIMQFSIELMVVRHYATALMIITPLVLLLTGAATGVTGPEVVLERIIDTVVGAALGGLSGLLHPGSAPKPDPETEPEPTPPTEQDASA